MNYFEDTSFNDGFIFNNVNLDPVFNLLRVYAYAAHSGTQELMIDYLMYVNIFTLCYFLLLFSKMFNYI